MKLVRFGKKGRELPGVYVNGIRLDCSRYFDDWDAHFFRAHGLDQLNELIAKNVDQLAQVDDDERWGSCIARPGMIICIGLNYSDHAKESGMDVPAEPILFGKAPNTIAGPFDAVAIPPNSEQTDWEVELGVVLQRDALYLENETEAAACIAGYCVVNDLSERNFQLQRGGQWIKGKSCPGFSPVGPFLVTADEIANPLHLTMQLSVNGVVRQNGSTETMIFSPSFAIHYISQFMQLDAGDLLSTGTPPGVGLGMDPPMFLKAGDEVRLSIEGLGEQHQKFTE